MIKQAFILAGRSRRRSDVGTSYPSLGPWAFEGPGLGSTFAADTASIGPLTIPGSEPFVGIFSMSSEASLSPESFFWITDINTGLNILERNTLVGGPIPIVLRPGTVQVNFSLPGNADDVTWAITQPSAAQLDFIIAGQGLTF